MQNGWNVLFFIYKNQRRNHWDRQRKQAYWHTGTPAHQHTGTPAHRHTSTLAHQHTGTLAHTCGRTLFVSKNQCRKESILHTESQKDFFFVRKIYLAKKRLTLAHPHTGTPAHWHTGTPAHQIDSYVVPFVDLIPMLIFRYKKKFVLERSFFPTLQIKTRERNTKNTQQPTRAA